MFGLLENLFKSDYERGLDAGRNAGSIQKVLHDAIPGGSAGFNAGFEDGVASQEEDDDDDNEEEDDDD